MQETEAASGPEAATTGAVVPDPMSRFRRWAGIAVALTVVGYIGYAAWKDLPGTIGELSQFRWSLYVPVLGLTLVNYGLRYAKWAWLLGRMGVNVPPAANFWIFLAGLAMVISPGKAGELVKPYLVREITGTPMVTTIPVLVAERTTDGIAVVMLAAIGVSTYYADQAWVIATTLAVMLMGLGIIATKPLSLGIIRALGRIPAASNIALRVEESYLALRLCLAPLPFAVTLLISLVAWFAECIGYWIIFKGLEVDASLDVATFLYSFATVFGAPMPGGLGAADAALAGGAQALVPGVTAGQALAAALLVRIATLWFGVVLGAIALLRMESVIQTYRRR